MDYIILMAFAMLSACLSTHCSTASTNLNDWFNQLNDDLHVIYQYSAHFAWELSVNANEKLAGDSRSFNAIKSKWSNDKCSEVQNLLLSIAVNQYPPLPSATTSSNLTILEATVRLLCSAPTFSEPEAQQLTAYLQEMQTIFTDTQVCLPRAFDICLNLDRIWELTYVSHQRRQNNDDSNGDLERLNLAAVKPKIDHKTMLHFFDGNITDGYYVKAASKLIHDTDDSIVEQAVRSSPIICFDGETDLDRIMSGDFNPLNRTDCALRSNEVFRWAWESWRAAVGTKIGRIYENAIGLMNVGAKRNGYDDIGDVWRHEVDLPNLQETIDSLMKQAKPFYQLLHGILRNVLWKRINKFEPFKRDATIPAHMLGSMWSQNWQRYQNLLIPFNEFSLDNALKKKNWTSIDMVKRADDFYRSLSLPPMTRKFWKRSIFEKSDQFRNCHGTAANMYQPNDYRMIVCAESTVQDLSVIVHEMGHLQYYMAFDEQPTIFQDGNAAIQESIGDAIFLGFMTPQHLNRLQLLPDKNLFAMTTPKLTASVMKMLHSHEKQKPHVSTANENVKLSNDNVTVGGTNYPRLSRLNDHVSTIFAYESNVDPEINGFDLSLLLRMALTKIPQIPFQYIMDAVRWNLFNGTVAMADANSFYWNMAMREQGIHPPDWNDRRNYFDLGAKFHVADNTPFTRYFLASFIQAQIFEGLCKVTVYGTVRPNKPLPMPLHRCDIYGSKRAGKLLINALKLGTSRHWTEILHMLTGSREISADSLLLYYKPLIVWLNKLAQTYDIPIGW